MPVGFGLGFFAILITLMVPNASMFLLFLCNYSIKLQKALGSMFKLSTCQFSTAYDKWFALSVRQYTLY